MKIAIVTVYDSIVNFGSFLQAYSLQQVLKNEGCEVAFVERMELKKILKRFNDISYKNSNIDLVPIYNLPRKFSRYKRYKRECKLNKKRFSAFLEDFQKINTDRIENINKYDALICGSDEIWNKKNKDIDIDFYTCKKIDKIKKYAYAISCGDMELVDYNESDLQAIKAFDYCLCRDENTVGILDSIGASFDKEIVCDPTILYGRDGFSTDKQSSIEYTLPEKYMFVYSYVYTKSQKKALREYANKNNLKIISASIDADFADETIITSALDFPYLLSNAECVFAATFHGAIFGMMYAKKLVILPRMHKIKSVVDVCEANSLTIGEEFTENDLEVIFSKDVNHEIIEENMEKIRNSSYEKIRLMLNISN